MVAGGQGEGHLGQLLPEGVGSGLGAVGPARLRRRLHAAAPPPAPPPPRDSGPQAHAPQAKVGKAGSPRAAGECRARLACVPAD